MQEQYHWVQQQDTDFQYSGNRTDSLMNLFLFEFVVQNK